MDEFQQSYKKLYFIFINTTRILNYPKKLNERKREREG